MYPQRNYVYASFGYDHRFNVFDYSVVLVFELSFDIFTS